MTNGSSQSRWESNVHAYVKPSSSAWRASSTTRHAGGFVCNTMPNSMPPPFCVWSCLRRRSARAWEPEVDRGGRRVRPATRDHLGPRVEAHALRTVHVRVPEQGRLPPAEAVVGDGHRDGHVHADHAG